jgi:hypothetical protein
MDAKQMQYPEQIWVGKVDAEWPIVAFSLEEQAMKWASENPDRSVVGPLRMPAAMQARRAYIQPATPVWASVEVE